MCFLYDTATTNGIFTLSGVVIGAIASYANSIAITKRQAFNKAAEEFRIEFMDEIITLDDVRRTKNHEDKGPFVVWKTRTPELLQSRYKAKFKFEWHVGIFKRRGFNKAWENYIEWYQYYDEDKQKLTEAVLSHTNNLLKYAKPK